MVRTAPVAQFRLDLCFCACITAEGRWHPVGPGREAEEPTSSDPLSRDRHPRGRAVRLLQGDYDRETAYDADPVDAARRAGRRAGRSGFTSSTSTAPPHRDGGEFDHVRRIARAVDPPLQLGGGLWDADAAGAALGAGAERVVIGTAALRDPGFLDAMLDRHGQRVVVGVDARSGMAATEGWVETRTSRPGVIRALAERGASRIVLTPIEVDGTMRTAALRAARDRGRSGRRADLLAAWGASTTCGHSRPSSCRRSVARSSAGRSTKGDSASRRRSRRCAGRAIQLAMAATPSIVTTAKRIPWKKVLLVAQLVYVKGSAASKALTATERKRLLDLVKKSQATNLTERERAHVRELVGKALTGPRARPRAGLAPGGAEARHPVPDRRRRRVVKGTNFVDIRDAGDPVELAERYDAEGADEPVFLDITASHEERDTIVELARRTADNVFIPFTIGGGIRLVADAQAVLDAGVDKVSVNSALARGRT